MLQCPKGDYSCKHITKGKWQSCAGPFYISMKYLPCRPVWQHRQVIWCGWMGTIIRSVCGSGSSPIRVKRFLLDKILYLCWWIRCDPGQVDRPVFGLIKGVLWVFLFWVIVWESKAIFLKSYINKAPLFSVDNQLTNWWELFRLPVYKGERNEDRKQGK